MFLPYFRDCDSIYFQPRFVIDPHTSVEKDPNKIIYLYEYPSNDLIDDYYYGRKRHGLLIDQFKRFIQEPAVSSFLRDLGCHYSFSNMPEVTNDLF